MVQTGICLGFYLFQPDGMKLFINYIKLVVRFPYSEIDQINQFRFECPYEIVSCSSEASQIIVSQVELAKQNISLNN